MDTSTKQAITIVISRPEHGLEIISMCKNQWTENREFTFFPDENREFTFFPNSFIVMPRSATL